MADRIFYYSTNRKINSDIRPKEKITFKEALFIGMAPDKGLFMPSRIPKISKDEILKFKEEKYHEVAYSILNKFLSDEIDDKKLKLIAKDALTFDIPVEKVNENSFIARLDQGPTASFKDFGARLMARLMQHLKPSDKKATILVATSGDTGSAVGEAYKGLEGFKVFILYPENGVSPLQKKQLDSIGRNVHSLTIKGSFDDCQRMVKEAFLDPGLKELNLTSANSINIGRILPQITYYFYIYSKVAENFEPVIFSIPSGNFGNSLGCEIARRMGLPVKKIIIATNENDGFSRFMKTGIYKKTEPAKNCLSNAMNIGNPSNLARHFDFYDGNIDKEGIVHENPDRSKMKEFIYSDSVSDKETIEIIKKIYKKYKILIEPHGAVGIAALMKYLNEAKEDKKLKSICLETAHPAKFPEIIKKELGFFPSIPASLKGLEGKESKTEILPNSYEKFKEYLLKNK